MFFSILISLSTIGLFSHKQFHALAIFTRGQVHKLEVAYERSPPQGRGELKTVAQAYSPLALVV